MHREKQTERGDGAEGRVSGRRGEEGEKGEGGGGRKEIKRTRNEEEDAGRAGGTGTDEEAQQGDTEAVEQIKVKLSAFTYLDERFELARLIISSPFFICAPLNPKAAAREESFPLPTPPLHPLPPCPLFLIRVITILPFFSIIFFVRPRRFSVSGSPPPPFFIHMRIPGSCVSR